MSSPDAIAKYLRKGVNRAVRAFTLIEAGDRIAVGVSGGKDSRTLLDLLVQGIDVPPQEGERTAHPPYTVIAIHIDGAAVGLPDFGPTLEPWFRSLGIPYEIAPLEVGEEEALPMDCFRCSWNRRKALFLAASRLGCNKVALGHHADDAAVTTLLSLMYKGQVETLSPSLDFFEGHLTVIRPLILVRESEITRYARASGWDLPLELSCPQGEQSRRVQIERFLGTLKGKERRNVRANLWRAGRKAMGF